jgi:hypothetical protein
MDQIISSKYIEFVEGNFEGKADILGEKYGDFDFVWFDCGGSAEYKIFMDEYWDICSDYISSTLHTVVVALINFAILSSIM